jgi:hypothetical protein
LCALTLALGAFRGAALPFWSDELATAHLADAPTWTDMMARGHRADLNPPLEPTLVRLSFDAFGEDEFAGHLPSVIGFTVLIGCMFVFLRRRVPASFAAFGALLLLANDDFSHYATEARPYGLLMGLLGLTLLAYDTVLRAGRHVSLARAVLLVAVTGMLQSHVFGALATAAFLAAEAVRTLRTRRFDIATWAALLLPLLSCVTYVPLLRQQPGGHTLVYNPESRASLFKAVELFHSLVYKPIAILIVVGFLLLMLLRRYPRRGLLEFAGFRAEMWVLWLGLLATSVLVALVFRLRAPGAGFYDRYSLAIVVPSYVLLTLFFAWRSEENRRVGKCLAALALLNALFTFSDVPADALAVAHDGLRAAADQTASAGGVPAVMPQLPLVVNDALRFFEADYRLRPADTKRMVYVSDEAEALRLEKNNATESIAAMARTFHIRSRVVPYPEFIAAHRQFLVLGKLDHRGWFLDEMLDRGADVRLLGSYRFAGDNQLLWLVTLDDGQAQ